MKIVQIVIDIPEEQYRALKCAYIDSTKISLLDFVIAIRNGTPLPKRHGRLIDADVFIMAECSQCDGYCDVCDCDCMNCKSEYRCEIIKDIDSADAIIEADKEVDE